MPIDVVLSLTGRQKYAEQPPEEIELITDGHMEFKDNGWNIVYQESELTGLDGVTTSFRIEPDKVILTRTGKLNSQMVFQKGVPHESLYDMEFGALLLHVNATKVAYDITEKGGTVDLAYEICIENTEAGVIDYHLNIKAK